MAGSLDLATASPEETRALGEALAGALRAGDVLSLTGDLGAGKTTLVQGAARGLAVEEAVLSPTFTLIRQYAGRYTVYHIDVYRLDRLQDVLDLGLDEILDQSGVVFIEWGDVIEALLPQDHLQVELTISDQGPERGLRITGRGPRWANRWDQLLALLETWAVAREGGPR
jgi:tRNA threonylcarbamoyladenosine biosynthesis protein TsaE